MKISGQGGAAPPARRELDDRGYILVVLLVSMAVAAVWMSAALPAWRQQAMREKELDLIFRGEQYARAIALYQIKNNTYPLDIDVLVSQRYLRKKWKDPVTGEDFQLVGLTSGQGGTPNRSGVPGGVSGGSPASTSRGGTPVGPGGMAQVPGGAPGRGPAQPSLGGQPLIGGVTGVRSVSQATSIRIYNGQQQHNLWQFDAAMLMARMGRNQAPAGQGRGDGRGGDGRGGPGARPGGAGTRPGGRPGGAGPGRGPGPDGGPVRGGPPPPGGGPPRGGGS